MVGLEVEPEDCGEICLVEVFGDTLADGPVAAVGHGIKRIRDPRLREDFVADPRPIDVTRTTSTPSTGGRAKWTSCSTASCCGQWRRRRRTPMQLIVGVFDFPRRAAPGREGVAIPELVVRRVSGLAPGAR
jgi:hypothetical protein